MNEDITCNQLSYKLNEITANNSKLLPLNTIIVNNLEILNGPKGK